MGDIVMSQKERQRLEVMSRVREHELTLVKAQEWLRISYRQTKRIWRRYCAQGDRGLVHLSRGRSSGRSKSADMQAAVLEKYRQVYTDFGPTLASEHLANDAGGAGSQGRAHRDFPHAGGRPGEQQIGDIDTGDEEQGADRPQQGIQHRPNLADHLVEQGLQLGDRFG